MTWPNVLRWLALMVGGAASLAGLAWTLGRIFRPWMREAAEEATNALYERLKHNDFRHVEDAVRALGERIERVEARAREDRAAMEARIDKSFHGVNEAFRDVNERLNQMEDRRAAMEARIMAAVASGPVEPSGARHG